MAARNVAPTRANLIALKQELTFARQGHELLDQKRNILIIELLSLVDQAVDFQERIDARLDKAHRSFRSAVMAMGRLAAHNLTSTIHIRAAISLSERRVMGVRLPVVETSFEEHAPYYSPGDTSVWIDSAHLLFRDTLRDMGRLAELKVSIMRLAREVRKTIRKVNALEKIAIPELEETVSAVSMRLEENERDMHILMKRVKARLERKEAEP